MKGYKHTLYLLQLFAGSKDFVGLVLFGTPGTLHLCVRVRVVLQLSRHHKVVCLNTIAVCRSVKLTFLQL